MTDKKLTRVCISTTDRCNESCRFCFAHKPVLQKDMTLQESQIILRNLKSLGITKADWSGGESLLVKDIFSMIRQAKELGFSNTLTTNGKALTSSKVAKLKTLVDRVNLSFCSLNPLTNSIMGKDAEHIELIFRKIRELQEQNLPLRINTVITKQNICDVEPLVKKLTELGVTEQCLMEYSPLRGIAKEHANMFSISHNEYLDLVQELSVEYPIIVSKSQNYIKENYLNVASNGTFYVSGKESDVIIGNPLDRSVTLEQLEKGRQC